MSERFHFSGGVHPADGKALAAGAAIQAAPLLEKYVVPLVQHIGAPPKLTVKKGDTVRKGQVLAASGGFVSAPVHAPTSGTVSAVTECPGPAGPLMAAVEIASDGQDTPDTQLEPWPDWERRDPADLLKRIADAGLVGMGGAAFPTHVKLSPPPAKKIDTLILNGVECEPCLTADHRLMLEAPERILAGARIMARILGVSHVRIGIEMNKPDAIARMAACGGASALAVEALHVRYPQGAEKQLIFALTGRRVPTGGLPMDVGCVVQNVGTAAAVADAVIEGRPLIERVTTVTGTPVVRPGNWRVRVGTPYARLFEWAGGVKADPAKIVSGGPMMGLSVCSLDVPVMKSTSGILALTADETAQYTSHACIACGGCVDVCPMRLMPGTLSLQIENERFDLAEAWRAADCIECGCCAYTCPAHRPLVQHLRRAKAEILAKRRAQAAGKKSECGTRKVED